MDTLLAIDKDIQLNAQATAAWLKIGINTIRVDCVKDAIQILIHDDKFLLIAINEDSVPDYISMLPYLRDITETPILIVTSSYTVKKDILAMQNGADSYGPFAPTEHEDVMSALELLKVKRRWAKQDYYPLPLLLHDNLILSSPRREVLVDNKEVKLTKKEFDILEFLMSNKGYVLTHERLIHKIWGEEYTGTETDLLWRTIDSLRKKLGAASKFIVAERGIGYKFSA